MSGRNVVVLVGRLGRDPETRYTGGGQAVCNFSLATDESFKSKSGERQKRTEWHKIVVWGKQAEIAQQYLKKGSQIFLEGRIQSREWMDKENQKRTSFEIVATNFRMLGSRSDSMGGGPRTAPRRRRAISIPSPTLRMEQMTKPPPKFPTKTFHFSRTGFSLSALLQISPA